ncbi:MAG: hypothetical protein PVF58_02140 [Candidatus Methanofastidiosia archaeon]|jgi:hypothetical protein
MKKSLVYTIAVVVLVSSLVIGSISYRMLIPNRDRTFASGVLHFGKQLHFADTEHPLHFEGGEHSFYEVQNPEYPAYIFPKILITSAFLGICALVLLHYKSTKSD